MGCVGLCLIHTAFYEVSNKKHVQDLNLQIVAQSVFCDVGNHPYLGIIVTTDSEPGYKQDDLY